jgi:hypothetical protein
MGDFRTRHPGANSGRGFSKELWADCPRSSIESDPDFGWYFRDDFMDVFDLTNRYTLTQATAGTFAMIDDDETAPLTDGGIAALDCGSSTVAQGGNVQASSTVGARFKPQANSKIWFEARIAVADLTAGSTGPEFYCGLAEIDTTIIGSSALSTANHVGFSSVTDDGVLISAAEKASAAHTGTTMLALGTAPLLADVTWHKIGFRITNLTKVEFFVDGVQKSGTGDNVATANIPIVAMVPSLVCHSDGTVDPIVYIDWWDCYQSKRT